MNTKIKNSTSQLPRTTNSFKTPYRKRYEVELLPMQKEAYQKLIKGIKAYPIDEVRKMTEEDKRTILYRQNRTWMIINAMKQSKLNTLLGSILISVFPDLVGNAVPFLMQPVTDNNFIVSRDLKECEVSTIEIIKEFVVRGFLPNNFLA